MDDKILEVNDTLAAGETDWLLQYVKPHNGKFKQKDLDDFVDFIDRRVAIEVKFCSEIGAECWTKCSTPDKCSIPSGVNSKN